ncbi:centrosomal protein of 192 kDa-like isoform X2 [Gigantopelta aegis]|uniref:centrosomal protein of 192 kDa-like isoform X2 n=1 Tax=Gigantopelta aegis TaxID=1735272 RepID=UPI001B8891DC|nr:centrosomal protein of 192 kDa-like isoform X2 [Gigantopelta aegis]
MDISDSSINCMPTPLATSTAARDRNRLRELAATDPRGSYVAHGIPDAASPWSESDTTLPWNDQSHRLTESESRSSLGILDLDAMPELSDSQFLLDTPANARSLPPSLGSSDSQPLGRSDDVNTVKKRPSVDRHREGALNGIDLFGGGELATMSEESMFDASVINIQFDDDELDELDGDFSHHDDYEHGQGEGQESDEEIEVSAFQGQAHGCVIDPKYILSSPMMHRVGDGEDSRVKQSRNYRTGLEGASGEPEVNRYSMMLRQSAEGEIMVSPQPGDGGGGGDGTSGSESDDGQMMISSSVASQSVPHRFAPGTGYQPTSYRQDSFPEEERIQPMGDDLLTETSSVKATNNEKFVDSLYLKPSSKTSLDGIQPADLTDGIFDDSGVCDGQMDSGEQTMNNQAGSDNQEMPDFLNGMRSSMGLFGLSGADIPPDSTNDATFTGDTATDVLGEIVNGTDLAQKTSLSGEAIKHKEMLQNEDSFLPLEENENFLNSGAAQEMMNQDEEEFLQTNIFTKDDQMQSSYRSTMTNSLSSWDEYNPLNNISMSLYWAARTGNIGTLDGNPSCPRPNFGMDVQSPPSNKLPEPLYRTSGVGDEDGDNTLIMEDLLNTPDYEKETVPKPAIDCSEKESLEEEISRCLPAATSEMSLTDRTIDIDSSALQSFLRKPATDGTPSNFLASLAQVVQAQSKASKKNSSKTDHQLVDSNKSRTPNVSRLPIRKGSNVSVAGMNKQLLIKPPAAATAAKSARTVVSAVSVNNTGASVEEIAAERNEDCEEGKSSVDIMARIARRTEKKSDAKEVPTGWDTLPTERQNGRVSAVDTGCGDKASSHHEPDTKEVPAGQDKPTEKPRGHVRAVDRVSDHHELDTNEVPTGRDRPRERSSGRVRVMDRASDHHELDTNKVPAGRDRPTERSSGRVRAMDRASDHNERDTKEVLTGAERSSGRVRALDRASDHHEVPAGRDRPVERPSGHARAVDRVSDHHERNTKEVPAGAERPSGRVRAVDRASGPHKPDTNEVPAGRDRPSERPSSGVRAVDRASSHHEPDGTEYSAASNYLSTDKKLSRDLLVGTSDIKMAESRGYGVMTTDDECLNPPVSLLTQNDRDVEGDAALVSATGPGSNRNTVTHSGNEIISSRVEEEVDNEIVCLRTSETGDLTAFSTTSSGRQYTDTRVRIRPSGNSNRFSATFPTADAVTGSLNEPAGGTQCSGQILESDRISSSSTSVSSGATNTSNAQQQSSSQSSINHKSNLSTTTIPLSSGAMTVDDRSVAQPATSHVPNPDESSSFEPLHESLLCSGWNPEQPSWVAENNKPLQQTAPASYFSANHAPVSSENSCSGQDVTGHSFTDLQQDVSHFSPTCRSTPYQSQTRSSVTYVSPNHARSVFSTMTADEVTANAGNISVSATPFRSSLLVAPTLLMFPHACCVGTSLNTTFPLRNPSPRWLQCDIVITLLEFNGRPLSPDNLSPFDVKRKVVVEPRSEEKVQVIFLPSSEGMYVADIAISTSSFLGDAGPSTMYLPITLRIQAISELPNIQLITREDKGIEFGEITWGRRLESEFGVVNISKARVPLRLVISSVNSAWHCFTFDNGSQSRELSEISQNSRPVSPALGRGVLTLSMSGCEEHTGETVEHIKIYCRPPARSFDRGVLNAMMQRPPERLLARLDVELDTPVRSAKLIASIILRASLGVTKLKTSATSQRIVLRCPADKVAGDTIRLRNAGNISMRVELFLSIFEDMFAIEPNFVTIPAHSFALISVKFLPKKQAITAYKTLLIMLTEPESQAYELQLTGEVQATLTPTPTPTPTPTRVALAASCVLGNKTALVFGCVVIGQEKLLRTVIKNSGPSTVTVSVAIQSESTDFQLQEVVNSSGEALNPASVVLNPGDRSTISVRFAPSSLICCTGKIAFRHSGAKFSIGLSGYGGTGSIALERVSNMGGGQFMANIGTLSLGVNSVTEVVLRNTGTRAAYVKALVCSDRQGCHVLTQGNVAVEPDAFVLAPEDSKVVSIMVIPSDRELSLCRVHKEVIAYIYFFLGDEVLRQNYRRAVSKRLSSKVPLKHSAVQRVDFGIVYMGEHSQTEEPRSRMVAKDDIDAFYVSMRQHLLMLVAEPPVDTGVSMMTISPGLLHEQSRLAARGFSDTASSLDVGVDRNLLQQTALVNQPLENYVPNWEIQPEQIVLTVCPSNSEITRSKKFQILNYASQSMRYDLVWPDHMLIVDPTHGIVGPKSSISVSVIPVTNAHRYLNHMPWKGTIKVDSNSMSKLLNVQIALDVAADQSSTSRSLDDLGAQLSTTSSILVPSAHNDAIKITNLEVRFPKTKVDKQSEDVLQFTNNSGCSIFWMLSSFAPPYVKGVGGHKEVFRLNYAVFQFADKSGQLKPNETAKICVCFRPQSKGLYTQYWDIVCKVKSATGKTSATTRVHLVGEAQTGDEQQTPQPRGVMVEIPVSENKTKAASESRVLEKKSARSVYLMSSSLTFPPSVVGMSVSRKVQIGNDVLEQQEVKVVPPRPPFYIKHTTFSINSNKFMKYPVEFRGKEKGVYHCTMVFQTRMGDLHLELNGECI